MKMKMKDHTTPHHRSKTDEHNRPGAVYRDRATSDPDPKATGGLGPGAWGLGLYWLNAMMTQLVLSCVPRCNAF